MELFQSFILREPSLFDLSSESLENSTCKDVFILFDLDFRFSRSWSSEFIKCKQSFPQECLLKTIRGTSFGCLRNLLSIGANKKA
jgi:hypothetical protein